MARLKNSTPIDTLLEVNFKYQREDDELFYPILVEDWYGVVHLTITRPDILMLLIASQFKYAPRHLHLLAVKQMIGYVLGTSEHGLFFLLDLLLSKKVIAM